MLSQTIRLVRLHTNDVIWALTFSSILSLTCECEQNLIATSRHIIELSMSTTPFKCFAKNTLTAVCSRRQSFQIVAVKFLHILNLFILYAHPYRAMNGNPVGTTPEVMNTTRLWNFDEDKHGVQ
jgi:hypothetical protein